MNNYLQLLYKEVKGILLHKRFLRPILHTKHPERSEGCFFKQNWSYTILSSFKIKMRDLKLPKVDGYFTKLSQGSKDVN